MGDLLRIYCEENGHVPRDWDPTGGDPSMGGPVAITVCDRCGIELPHSDTARAFNAEMAQIREQRRQREQEDLIRARVAWDARPRWWQFWRSDRSERA